MILRSDELNKIQREVGTARNTMWDTVKQMKDHGDEGEYEIARSAYSHLLDAYMELVSAAGLLEALEGRR